MTELTKVIYTSGGASVSLEDFNVLKEVVAELEVSVVELEQRVDELEKKRYVRTKKK